MYTVTSEDEDNIDIIKIKGGQIGLIKMTKVDGKYKREEIKDGAVYLLLTDFVGIQSTVTKIEEIVKDFDNVGNKSGEPSIGVVSKTRTQQPIKQSIEVVSKTREYDSTLTPVNDPKFLFDGVTITFYTHDGEALGKLIKEAEHYETRHTFYIFENNSKDGIPLSDIYIKNEDKPNIESAYERFMEDERGKKIKKLTEYINTYNVNINKFKTKILTDLGNILT